MVARPCLCFTSPSGERSDCVSNPGEGAFGAELKYQHIVSNRSTAVRTTSSAGRFHQFSPEKISTSSGPE